MKIPDEIGNNFQWFFLIIYIHLCSNSKSIPGGVDCFSLTDCKMCLILHMYDV